MISRLPATPETPLSQDRSEPPPTEEDEAAERKSTQKRGGRESHARLPLLSSASACFLCAGHCAELRTGLAWLKAMPVR